MGRTFIALSADDEARFYGLGERGVGHVILIGAGFHGDPLAHGETVEKACGGSALETARLTEKFTGDRMCARCVKWLASAGGQNDLEAARQDKWDAENGGESLAEALGRFTLITLDDVQEVEIDRDELVRAERERMETRKAARERGDTEFLARKGAPRKPSKSKSKGARETSPAGMAPGAERDAVVRALWSDNGPEMRNVRRKAAVERERERLTERAKSACEGTGKAPAPGTRVSREDHTVSVPDDFQGKHSAKCPAPGCGRIIAVSREGGMRRHNPPAPAAPAAPVAEAAPVADARESVTGLSVAEMVKRTETYYAAGGTVPAEIARLPKPGTAQITGTVSGKDAGVLECEFAGGIPDHRMNPERTHGKCPECSAYIPLTDNARGITAIGKHNVGGVASPANSAQLSSVSIDTVEHGSVPGSPADASKRRHAEIMCDRSGRVVRNSQGGSKVCTGCTRNVELQKRIRTVKGETKTVWVYPEHVDARDTFTRAPKSERKVTPRGTGADAGKGQRDHGSVNGSATTGRPNLAPIQPKRGWLATAGTMTLSATVRADIDGGVAGKFCPVCQERPDIAHRGKSRGWRRNHSRLVASWHRENDARRKAQEEREIAKGQRLPKGARKAARKAASIGSFQEGTNGSTGTVARGTERPADTPAGTPVRERTRPVSKRTPAPGEAEALTSRSRKARKSK